MFQVRTQDSRNTNVPLHDPARKRLISASADRGGTGLGVITEATGQRVRGGTSGTLSTAIGYSLGGAFMALLAITSFLSRSYGMGVFWLLVLSYMLFELFLKRWYRRWRHREQILRALRALDRCGSCGYELKGIGVQEDGCQVCPECGAAWRADKVRSEGEPRWVRPKPWHRKYVHDDRGWRCRPYFGVRASLLGRGMKRRRLLLARSGPLGWVSYSLGYLVLVVLVAGIASAYLTEEWIILLWVMGFAFAGLVTQAILWPVAWWVRCEPMRLALLERGMCVCCHSALPGEAEPDGRRVCALCGSAWLTPRDSTGE